MRDYGRAMQFLASQGRAWDYPGKQPQRPVVPPEKWDIANPEAWDAVMAEREFDSVDERRWCFSTVPTENRFGVTIIVGQPQRESESAVIDVSITIDTLETENTSEWWYPEQRFATPLEAVEWALSHVRTLLSGALARLP